MLYYRFGTQRYPSVVSGKEARAVTLRQFASLPRFMVFPQRP